MISGVITLASLSTSMPAQPHAERDRTEVSRQSLTGLEELYNHQKYETNFTQWSRLGRSQTLLPA